jgi:AraC family transcriptional regulator, exoenzyme S synthesis regulatory protein ExsA
MKGSNPKPARGRGENGRMRNFALPDDIPGFPASGGDGVFIHPFSAPVGSFKGRSVLNGNAISLVIAGEKTIRFAEKNVEIRPDEFHFLSTGNCLVSMEVSEKIRFQSILIFFGNDALAGFLRKYRDRVSAVKGAPRVPDQPYLSFKKDAFIRGFMDSLGLLLRNGALSAEMAKLKFEELLLYLLDRHPRGLLSFQALKGKPSEAAVIRAAVENHLTHPIGLEELAYLCNLSLSTFKRRFAKLYGAPPNQWILRRRMELARDLLARGSDKPSQIYPLLGYRNHSSFTESFKQVFGLTPKAFQSQRLNVQP